LKGIKIKDIGGERIGFWRERRGTLKKGDTENTQRKKREREREKRKNGTLRTKKEHGHEEGRTFWRKEKEEGSQKENQASGMFFLLIF